MSDQEGSFKAITKKPDYTIKFYRSGGEQVGVLDFNGPAMKFEGNAEESARLLFDWLTRCFYERLEEERQKEREACAKIADQETSRPYRTYGAAIRARSTR